MENDTNCDNHGLHTLSNFNKTMDLILEHVEMYDKKNINYLKYVSFNKNFKKEKKQVTEILISYINGERLKLGDMHREIVESLRKWYTCDSNIHRHTSSLYYIELISEIVKPMCIKEFQDIDDIVLGVELPKIDELDLRNRYKYVMHLDGNVSIEKQDVLDRYVNILNIYILSRTVLML
jgi:hypothetical protein